MIAQPLLYVMLGTRTFLFLFTFFVEMGSPGSQMKNYDILNIGNLERLSQFKMAVPAMEYEMFLLH